MRLSTNYRLFLISSKYISCVNFILYIVQTCVIAVSDDCMAFCLEGIQIVNDLAAEKSAAVFKCRLVDDNLCSLCFDAFHDSLNGRLAEVVGVGLHREAIDAYHTVVLLGGVKAVVGCIAIITGSLQYGICYVVLASAVALYDGLYEVFRNICIVCQKLFGILRQTVAAITE